MLGHGDYYHRRWGKRFDFPIPGERLLSTGMDTAIKRNCHKQSSPLKKINAVSFSSFSVAQEIHRNTILRFDIFVNHFLIFYTKSRSISILIYTFHAKDIRPGDLPENKWVSGLWDAQRTNYETTVQWGIGPPAGCIFGLPPRAVHGWKTVLGSDASVPSPNE